MAGRPRPGSWSTSGTSTAILPSDGTLILDRTYVELPGLSNPLREAARDVRDFLLDPAQQDRFADVGFRDDHDEASDGLVRTLHLNSGQPPGRLGRPTADVIAAIRTGWRQLSKRANLRVVVDESGDGAAQRHRRPGRSYGGREGRAAGRDGRPQPGGHDWLLGFASDPAGPHRQLLPISAYGDGRDLHTSRRRAADRVEVARQHAVVRHDSRRARIPADAPGPEKDQCRGGTDRRAPRLPGGPGPCAMGTLGDQRTAKDPDHLVKVFGISIGDRDQVDFPALQRVRGATGAIASDLTSDPTRLDKTFTSVFSSVSPGR